MEYISYLRNRKCFKEMSYQYLQTNILKIEGSGGDGYTFPLTDGTNAQVLSTDGSGNVQWTTESGGNPSQGSFGTLNVSNGANGWQGTGYTMPISAGSTNQVLTTNGVDTASWQNMGGSLPVNYHTSIGIMNFGFSSDATNCFTQGLSAYPFYWQPSTLPAPSTDHSYSPIGNENYGTVAVDLPAGNYSFSMTVLAAPAGGIVDININGNITSVDTYTSDTNNENQQVYIPFTVTGSGWVTNLINFTANGKNSSSSGYIIYISSTGIDIDTIYTGGGPP